MHIMRTFNGTGATVYLGLGFLPDWVKVFNHEITAPTWLEWNRGMRTLGPCGWLVEHVASGATITRCAGNAGIEPFYGRRLVTGDSATAYLRAHTIKDQRGQGTLGWIGNFIETVYANRTGYLDHGVPATVGVGSLLAVKEKGTGGVLKTVSITTCTNDGDASGELTLSDSVHSGEVLFLGPMYDLIAGTVGDQIPQGVAIMLNAFNVSADYMSIEAGTYDD
jgi:hypothetical protein